MEPPEKPQKPKGPGFGARRGKRPLKHLKVLRGDGGLEAAGRKIGVGYQLDLYADGDRTIGTGSLDADFTGLAEALEGTEGRLTLEDGTVMTITLETVEDDGAEFEAEASGA